MKVTTYSASFLRDFYGLLFPRMCPGCSHALSRGEDLLCSVCLYHLPKTGFHFEPMNLVAQRFLGRLPLIHGLAYLHFHKGGMVQSIMHEFKYGHRPDIGERLGEWFGEELHLEMRAPTWDVIVSVPLHKSRKRRRGYNQSDYFARGLSKGLRIPFLRDIVTRHRRSQSQTGKSKSERWENVRHSFSLRDPSKLKGQHVLLVDDVITTGATLEACGGTLLEACDELSVASLAIARF